MSTTIIGIDKCHFAKVTSNTGKEVYDKPVYLAPVQEFTLSPETNTASQYGDNRAVETASAMGAIESTIKFTGMSPEKEALILGHKVSGKEGQLQKMVRSANDIAPLGAIMYRRLRADGGYRYKVLYKGRFSLPEETTTTKEDSIEFQSAEYTVNFMPRNDGVFDYVIDEPAGSTEWASKFFETVVEPEVGA